MVVTRRSRARFTDLPPEMTCAIVAAACPEEAAVAAKLSATCRSLRSVVLPSRTAVKLQGVGRGQQIASLLQRLTGLQQVTLADCVCDAVLWQELGQLQHLQHLTLPLQLAASSMQPLTALQQLTALAFTSGEHSTARQLPALPTAVIAALSCLEVLDASACGPLAAAGLQELSRLQRLEVLHVPRIEPRAITQLAAHLPSLRSLDLWYCTAAYAHQEVAGQLTLATATALTELRLHVCTTAADTVRRLQMPPRLQALDVCILTGDTAPVPDDIMAVINALPLQCLSSFSLLYKPGSRQKIAYDPPQTKLLLPDVLPRLWHLHFGNYLDWDAMGLALWPLAVRAAHSTCEPEGDAWRLRVTVQQSVYSLTATDILQPRTPLGNDTLYDTLRGHLTTAYWLESEPVRMLREGESEQDVLWALLAHETQMTRLELPCCGGLERDEVSAVYQQLGSLTALRHLDAIGSAWELPEPTPSECCALGRLHQLTTLAIPFCFQKSLKTEQAALHSMTNLRQLKAHLPLTPDTLAALRPLNALTQLHLDDGDTESAFSSEDGQKRRNLRDWASLRTLQLPLRQLQLAHDDVGDEVLAATLAHMPCLQELEIEFDFKLEGEGLEVLPRCCPSLKALRLKHLRLLTDCFLPALQQLQDLVEFDVAAAPMELDVPCVRAAHFPPSLTTLSLRYIVDRLDIDVPDECQCETGRDKGWGAFMSGVLDSLPTLRAPLRVLALQRGNKTPFTDADMECLAAAAQQLQQLEILDLGDVLVTSGGLQRLLALPALVELTVHTFVDDLENAPSSDESHQRYVTLVNGVDELKMVFELHGRSLAVS